MKRIALALSAAVVLAGCAEDVVWAPDEAVAQAAYRHDGPPMITLYTVINNGSGNGAHSGLLINGSQRVLFDPAGSFNVNVAPERHDVHYGMTEQLREFYELFHARSSFHVIAQDIEVSPEVAELAIRKAQEYGAVPKAMCAVSMSTVLSELPGFEAVKRTMMPNNLMEAVATIEGVSTRKIEEYDDDDKSIVLADFQAAMARSLVTHATKQE